MCDPRAEGRAGRVLRVHVHGVEVAADRREHRDIGLGYRLRELGCVADL
jgi:hypothetical protein